MIGFRRTVLLVLFAVVVTPVAVLCDGGKFRETPHGKLRKGVSLKSGVPTGSCRQCHGMHTDRTGTSPHSAALSKRLEKNEMCEECHSTPSGTSWLGMNEYRFSSHGSSVETYPRQNGREVRLCLQCHDPHGKTTRNGNLIPSMLRDVEERTCMGGKGKTGGCHSADSSRRPISAKDLQSEMRKQYAHRLRKKTFAHKADEVRRKVAGQVQPQGRHVECVDCHNPHISQNRIHEPGTNRISPMLLGTYGVRPISWPPAGGKVTGFEVVLFELRRSRTDSLECYLCFRCHSYYEYGHSPPPYESDMTVWFNPNNASYHPVAAQGKNPEIPSLLPPWRGTSTMYCSDCHGSDEDPSERVPFGPHASRYEHILRRSYPEDETPPRRDQLCFLCHDPEAYLRGGRLDSERDSGFVAGGRNLHVIEGHTAAGCITCHTVHGSPDYPHLLVVRNPNFRLSRIRTIDLPRPGEDYLRTGCSTIAGGGVGCHD